jgi:hypothetical protein
MSAYGTKRTSPSALHMSAFGGKADIIQTCGCVCFCPIPDIQLALAEGLLSEGKRT